MKSNFNKNQFVPGKIKPVDGAGNAAAVQAGSVIFSSSNETVCTVERDGDGSDESLFKIVGQAAGTAQLSFSADADLGEGVETISAFIDVEITEPKATSIGIELGEPQNKE